MRPQRIQQRRLHGRRLGGDLPPDPRQPRERGLPEFVHGDPHRPRGLRPSEHRQAGASSQLGALLRCGRSPRPAAAAGWAGGPPLVPRGRRPTLRRDPSRPRPRSPNATWSQHPRAVTKRGHGRRDVVEDEGEGDHVEARVGEGKIGATATSKREAASGRSRCATRIIAGSGSTAVTTAPRRVAAAASRPVPVPTSRTSLPSSRRRSATASSSGSTTPLQVSAKARS